MSTIDLNDEQTIEQLEKLILSFKTVAIKNQIGDRIQAEALLMLLFDLAKKTKWTKEQLDTLIKYILVSVEQ
jgi:hypothetical protein